MSEDVSAKLARFTPTGLDRDAVLYAAGKAAGRTSVWKWCTLALAVTNVMTVSAFTNMQWTPETPAQPGKVDEPVIPISAPIEYPQPAPFSYSALMNSYDRDDPHVVPDDGESPRSVPLTPRSWSDPRFN